MTLRRYGVPRALRLGAQLVLGLGLGPSDALALEGLVVGKADHQPVAHAEVTVIGGPQTARTGPDGKFVLVPEPHVPFELLVILPDGRYARPVLFESVAPTGPLVVEIVPLLTDNVRAAAPGIHAAPASASMLVSREDMRARQPQSLAQALESAAGVSNVSEGQASVPAIRGLAQARSLILIDGARVTAERRIGPSATYLDPVILEGLELTRGPGSVAYGSDALGGVILARTRRPIPGGDPAFEFTGTLGAGVPQGRAALEFQAGLTERSGVLLAVHERRFDDYMSPVGEVFNSGGQDSGFLARYAYVLPRGVLSVGLQVDRGRDIERPRTNSTSVRFYYPREDSDRWTVSYDSGPALGLDSIELALSLDDYRLMTDQDQFQTATEPREIARADVSARDFGLRAAAAERWGRVGLDFGVDVNGRFDLEAEDVTIAFDLAGQQTQYDALQTIEEARRIDAGLFVSATSALSPVVSLSGGLRFDRVDSQNEGGFFGDVSTTHSEPSGFAALTLGSFSGFSFTLQAAHGFRDARLSDRFFRGVTGAGFITGNPDLEPETSSQYDLAVHHVRGRWRSAAYLYHYRIADLIERYEDPNQAEFFFFRNRGRVRIQGFEVETQAQLSERLALQVGAALCRGESLDDGSALDDIQPEHVFLQVRRAVGQRGFVQLRGALFGAHDDPGPNEVEIPHYGVLDASAGFKFGPSFELQLLGRNLFDKSYPLSTDRRSPVAPGRAGLLTAHVTF